MITAENHEKCIIGRVCTFLCLADHSAYLLSTTGGSNFVRFFLCKDWQMKSVSGGMHTSTRRSQYFRPTN